MSVMKFSSTPAQTSALPAHALDTVPLMLFPVPCTWPGTQQVWTPGEQAKVGNKELESSFPHNSFAVFTHWFFWKHENHTAKFPLYFVHLSMGSQRVGHDWSDLAAAVAAAAALTKILCEILDSTA